MILGQRLAKFQNTMGNKLTNAIHTLGNKYVDKTIDNLVQHTMQQKPKINFSNLERYNGRKKLLSQ